jgi:hypothetical protein
VSFTAVGTCVVDANQAGNANYNAAPQVQQSFAVFGNVAGLTFANTKVGGNSVTPTCTGAIGTTYSCTVSGQGNNAIIAANVVFANSSGTATVYSAQNQSVNWTSTGKSVGTGTVTILGNQNSSSTTVSAQRNGNSGGASVTVTYTTAGGHMWTAVLTVS